jgi:hypothetical protein
MKRGRVSRFFYSRQSTQVMASVKKLPQDELNKLHTLLINGHGLTKTSKQTGLPYSLVQSVRKRMVEAGVVKPLYKTSSKKRASRKHRIPAEAPAADVDTTVAQDMPQFTLMINGTQIDLKNVKSVFISPELVDVKY